MNIHPPAIGRIVGYRPRSGDADTKVRPAMIVEVPTDALSTAKDRVELQVFSPLGGHFTRADWSAFPGEPGTWFWLPKVADREVEANDHSATPEAQDPSEAPV